MWLVLPLRYPPLKYYLSLGIFFMAFFATLIVSNEIISRAPMLLDVIMFSMPRDLFFSHAAVALRTLLFIYIYIYTTTCVNCL